MPKDNIPDDKYSKRCLSTEAAKRRWEEPEQASGNGAGHCTCKLEDSHLAVLLKLVRVGDQTCNSTKNSTSFPGEINYLILELLWM